MCLLLRKNFNKANGTGLIGIIFIFFYYVQ
jgi:hypothetical protein